VPLIENRTVMRSPRSYSTDYTYRSTNYNDYGNPETITETGKLSRTTTRTYTYGFTPYLVGRVGTQSVSVSGSPPYVTNHSYMLSTGFRDSTTVHGITTDFDPTTSGGNVLRITDANGHATTFTYDYGVVKNTVTPEYTIERSIDVDGTVK
jgi:hypothetical protein